jgi:ferritin-like protein
MTKEDLIEAACEIIGGNAKELSVEQIQGLMTIIERLTDLSFNERRSFANLCAIRAIIDAAVALSGMADDLVTLRVSKEQCAFLLALVDKEIREHA